MRWWCLDGKVDHLSFELFWGARKKRKKKGIGSHEIGSGGED